MFNKKGRWRGILSTLVSCCHRSTHLNCPPEHTDLYGLPNCQLSPPHSSQLRRPCRRQCCRCACAHPIERMPEVAYHSNDNISLLCCIRIAYTVARPVAPIILGESAGLRSPCQLWFRTKQLISTTTLNFTSMAIYVLHNQGFSEIIFGELVVKSPHVHCHEAICRGPMICRLKALVVLICSSTDIERAAEMQPCMFPSSPIWNLFSRL